MSGKPSGPRVEEQNLRAVVEGFGPLSQPAPRAAAALRDPSTLTPQPLVAHTDGLTEAAHAERFCLTYGEHFRFDHRRGCYLRWDRTRWREDVKGERYRCLVELARDLY